MELAPGVKYVFISQFGVTLRQGDSLLVKKPYVYQLAKTYKRSIKQVDELEKSRLREGHFEVVAKQPVEAPVEAPVKAPEKIPEPESIPAKANKSMTNKKRKRKIVGG